MENPTDIDLMVQVQGGDLSKMGTLYERHKVGLFSYFYRCTNDRMKSEDLVQNTFIRVINYKDNFKGKGEFSYWLYFIARNTWIDEYRKKDPMNKISDLDSENVDAKVYEYDEEEYTNEMYKKQLELALQQISSEKRDAIVLSRFHGMTYKIIAEMSDCTENAIKSRVQRGIMEIKECLEKMNAV